MHHLLNEIEQMNVWAELTTDPKIVFPLSQDNVNHISNIIQGRLDSPEYLYADGERPMSEVRRLVNHFESALDELSTYSKQNGLEMPEINV